MNFRQDAACNITSFADRNNITSGTNNFTDKDDKPTRLKKQYLLGNKCGHSYLKPRIFEPPEHHKKRFPIIERGKKNLVHTYTYPLAYPIGKLSYHTNKAIKSGRFRKIRSEKREAIICRVGVALLHFNNIEKMELGHPTERGFFNYDTAFLLEKIKNFCPLNNKIIHITSSQLLRALKIFELCGYITLVENRIFNPDGSCRSRAAYIKVSEKFYFDLGILPSELIKHKKKEIRFSEKLAKSSQLSDRRHYHANEFPGKDRTRKTLPIYENYTGLSQKRGGEWKKYNQDDSVKKHFDHILYFKKESPS